MPLNTKIIRDEKPLQLKWREFHIACMVMASSWDAGRGPFVNNEQPEFEYTEGEFAGKTGADYPDVPAPVSTYNAFMLSMYPYIWESPLAQGRYKLKKPHSFIDLETGERLDLLPGDQLQAYRSMK